MKINDLFLTEMENMQIKKNNSFEFFNGKSNITKKEDDSKILLLTKINNKPKNLNVKMNNNPKVKSQPQNQNPINSTNTSTLAKYNILALFPSEGHMAIFDEIESIIKIFQMQFNKIPRDEILSVLNSTSFNIEQAYYDLYKGHKNFSFSSAEDYIIKHMKNCVEYQNLIELKGINNVIKREQYLLNK
jgi:hypothetical protein